MTLTMYDDIYVSSLPAGADAYLGYVNGNWPTWSGLKQAFPGAAVIGLSVFGATTSADGIDVENGDYTQAQGVAWMQWARSVNPNVRFIWYESASMMDSAISALAAAGIPPSEVRLLSAHYEWKDSGNPAGPSNAHICGPGTCGLVSTDMDGTQWTSSWPGAGGAQIDVSTLQDNFFLEDPVNPYPQSFVELPGLAGVWMALDFQIYTDSNGSSFAIGYGTDGNVWLAKRPAGAAWGAPVLQ